MLLSSKHCTGFLYSFAIQHVYESSFHLGFTCTLTALSAMNIAFILHSAGVQQTQLPCFVLYSSHVPQVLIVQMVYPPQVATHQSCSTWHDLVYRVHHRNPQLKKLACFYICICLFIYLFTFKWLGGNTLFYAPILIIFIRLRWCRKTERSLFPWIFVNHKQWPVMRKKYNPLAVT